MEYNPNNLPQKNNRRPEIGRWILILAICSLIAMAIGFIVTIRSPKIYEAKASVFVQTQKPSLTLPSEFAQLNIFGDSGDPASYATAILGSSDFARTIIKRLDLLENRSFTEGQKHTVNSAVEKLRLDVSIDDNKQGVISVVAESRSAGLASNIANAYLDLLMEKVANRNANKRLYIQEQTDALEADLERLEEELRDLSKRSEVVDLPEQTKTAVTELSNLQVQLIMLDSTLKGVESELETGGDITELARLKTQRESLIAQKTALQGTIDTLRAKLSDVPTVALEQARLTREINLKNELYKTLSQQKAVAQIDEQSESKTYQPLDRAFIPEWPSRPNLIVNLAVSLLLGITVGVAINLFITDFRSEE